MPVQIRRCSDVLLFLFTMYRYGKLAVKIGCNCLIKKYIYRNRKLTELGTAERSDILGVFATFKSYQNKEWT